MPIMAESRSISLTLIEQSTRVCPISAENQKLLSSYTLTKLLPPGNFGKQTSLKIATCCARECRGSKEGSRFVRHFAVSSHDQETHTPSNYAISIPLCEGVCHTHYIQMHKTRAAAWICCFMSTRITQDEEAQNWMRGLERRQIV